MISQSPVILIPENNSFEGKKSIVILKEVEIGRLIDDNATIPNTIKFKSKVVSRHHARLIFSDGQVRLAFISFLDLLTNLVLHSGYEELKWNISQWIAIKPTRPAK